MAKRRVQKSPAKRGARPSGGTRAALLGALMLLAAGGVVAAFLLLSPPTPEAAVRPVAAAAPTIRPASRPPPAGPGRAAAATSGEAVRIAFKEPALYPRLPNSWFEAQVALSRAGFSCGSIDGVGGAQTVAAWRAFQSLEGLAETSWLDPRTCAALPLETPPTMPYTVTEADLRRVQPLSPTWLGKSQQTALDFENVLELVAEWSRAHPNLLKKLNPDFDWTQPRVGAVVTVPAAARTVARAKAAALHIQLGAHTLQVYDADGRLTAHFPVSIARTVEKRPVGELHVTVAIRDPNYTFDPEVFPESAEGRELGRRLVVPPGPNNPVGVAWIGLDRTGYGIHGTPHPEQVGRTESHGCFRLANWDARVLLDLVWVGLPVYVDP